MHVVETSAQLLARLFARLFGMAIVRQYYSTSRVSHCAILQYKRFTVTLLLHHLLSPSSIGLPHSLQSGTP